LIEQDCEDDDEPQTLHTIALKMVDTLEQMHLLPEILDTLRRAIREPMEHPTPEAAPVVTDAELRQIWEGANYVEDALRAIYDLGRQHGAAPVGEPPVGGLDVGPLLTILLIGSDCGGGATLSSDQCRRAATLLQQPSAPLKERPDFIAGYRAGLIDGRFSEAQERAQRIDARVSSFSPLPQVEEVEGQP